MSGPRTGGIGIVERFREGFRHGNMAKMGKIEVSTTTAPAFDLDVAVTLFLRPRRFGVRGAWCV